MLVQEKCAEKGAGSETEIDHQPISYNKTIELYPVGLSSCDTPPGLYVAQTTKREEYMIPSKFIKTARAEYLCNVYEFIGIGEGKRLTPLEMCRIKSDNQDVQQWFRKLDTIAQLRVMKYLIKQHKIAAKPLLPDLGHRYW